MPVSISEVRPLAAGCGLHHGYGNLSVQQGLETKNAGFPRFRIILVPSEHVQTGRHRHRDVCRADVGDAFTPGNSAFVLRNYGRSSAIRSNQDGCTGPEHPPPPNVLAIDMRRASPNGLLVMPEIP